MVISNEDGCTLRPPCAAEMAAAAAAATAALAAAGLAVRRPAGGRGRFIALEALEPLEKGGVQGGD